MPDPPAYDPDTQYLNTHNDNGDITYEVVDKMQGEREDDDDAAFVRTFMDTPKAQVTDVQFLIAVRSFIRHVHRIEKAD